MTTPEAQFQLPRNIERYLATLSMVYAQEGQREKQEIIVNAQVRVHEKWSSDNWNGGSYGHALYLILPDSLYVRSVRQKEDLQIQIKTDINKMNNIPNEFIEEVFLEMEVAENQDWRRESGLLQPGKHVVPSETTKRIWGDGGFRVFLCHKTEVKEETSTIKAHLQLFGVSAFVAHVDIHPTKEWQDEIQNALSSMDAFVALLTEGFHDSLWTDQEVGFALSRGVPILAVRLGKDPYGFIGKFQALSCDWATAPKEIVGLLINNPRMLEAYMAVVRSCPSFSQGNLLSEILPDIAQLTEEGAQQLMAAFNENSEVRGSYGFNGTRPYNYGEGLAAHLSRATGRKYVLTSGKMQVVL